MWAALLPALCMPRERQVLFDHVRDPAQVLARMRLLRAPQLVEDALAGEQHLAPGALARHQPGEELQAARAEGKPFKLLARAKLSSDGKLVATVRPEQIAATDPLGNVRGTSLAIHFELDMMPGLTITSHRPNLQSTAYGLLADFINAVREHKPLLTRGLLPEET